MGKHIKGLALLSLVVSVAAGGLYLKGQISRLTDVTSPQPTWAVSLKIESDHELAEATIVKIHETARRNLGHGTSTDLNRTAAAVQKLDAFARVAVVRLGVAQVAISVTPRTPALCVEAGDTRLVGTEGEVYGTAIKDLSLCPGAYLTGIFEDRGKHLTAAADLTYPTTADELIALREAVMLQREFHQRKIPVKTLSFQRYRGFLATLSDPEALEVQLGRAPFPPKLDKLESTLIWLKDKGSHAERIELDYQGKAFVKFKKM